MGQRATSTHLTSCYHYLSSLRQLGALLAPLSALLILNRLAILLAMIVLSLFPMENRGTQEDSIKLPHIKPHWLHFSAQ